MEKEEKPYRRLTEFGPQERYAPIYVMRAPAKVESLVIDFLEISSELTQKILAQKISTLASSEEIEGYYKSRFKKIGKILSEFKRLEKNLDKEVGSDLEAWDKIQKWKKHCKEKLKSANQEMEKILGEKHIEAHIKREIGEISEEADRIKGKKEKTKHEIKKDNEKVHNLVKRADDLLRLAEKIKNPALQESAKNAIYTLKNRKLLPLIEELKEKHDDRGSK